MKTLGSALWDTLSVFDELFSPSRVCVNPDDLESFNVGVLVIWGCADVSPQFYGEQPNVFCEPPDIAREITERRLIIRAQELGIPVIGVGRGAHLLCTLQHGKIIQHVRGHMSSHYITTNSGETMRTHSEHHQMMLPAGNFELIAWSSMNLSYLYLGETESDIELPDDWKEPEIVYYPDVNSLAIQGQIQWMENQAPVNKYIMKFIKERMLKKEYYYV